MPYGIMNRIPYTLPDVIAPPGTRCIQITIPDNDQWETELFSLIAAEFGRWLMWERDVGKNGTKVAARWRVALKTWKHCDNSPSPISSSGVELPGMSDLVDVQVIDGKCTLVYRCCVGDPWIPAASMQDVLNATSSPGPTTNQPQPGGGTASNCVKMYANALLPIPLTVNTGDTILINSADGSWWDGGEFDFGPLWRVPNGDQFVGGLDVGFPRSGVSGDAVTAANHMSIVAVIGATPTYVALPIGTPGTVPSVAPNSQLFFMVNDDPTGIGNNQGDAQVCYTITNNKAAPWCKYYDFSLSGYGFTVVNGVWTPGIGYVAQFVSGADFAATIGLSFPSTTLTQIDMTYTKSNGAGSGDDGAAIYSDNPPSTILQFNAAVYGDHIHYVWNGSHTGTGFGLTNNSGSVAATSISINAVLIRGTGPVPPGGVVC
jgi:hypothetical protein